MPQRIVLDRAEAEPEAADRLDWPRRGLSARSRRVALAACEAMICDSDEHGRLVAAPPHVCERAVDAFDHSVGRSSADVRRAFSILSALLDWLPLFIIGVPRRMVRLPLERRLAYLEALEASKIGLLSMLLMSFKVPLCIPAFEQDELLRTTGFDRPTTVARRRLLPKAEA